MATRREGPQERGGGAESEQRRPVRGLGTPCHGLEALQHSDSTRGKRQEAGVLLGVSWTPRRGAEVGAEARRSFQCLLMRLGGPVWN